MSRRFSRLNREAMRKLSGRNFITEHGISFSRELSGDGVFSVNIMVDRQRIHRVIGRESEGVTRQQAEEFIALARTDAMRDRLDLPEGRKARLGFREAASKYIERLSLENGKNIRAKRRQLDQHLVSFFGDNPLTKISSSMIERYKMSRTAHGAAQATINRELAVLSHLLHKALEWKWIAALPGRIQRYKEGQGRILYLTADQCRSLLDAAAADQNPNVYCFVRVALATGMRHQEILAISRDDIDFDRNVIWIPKAKAGAREQPVTRELVEYLRERMTMLSAGCKWLLPSVGSKTGHVHTIRKAFQRAVGHAGLDPEQVTPHILRHTCITHLVQSGVDLPTVQRISGHKTLTMVVRYAHQNGEHIQKAMDGLQERLSLEPWRTADSSK